MNALGNGKKWMRAAVLALAALAVWSCGWDVPHDGGGVRRVRTERRTQSFDFGTARQGGVLQHTFQVANTGAAPITVSRVQTTCGCTAATVKKGAEIAPGGTLDVPVDLNLRGKKGAVESKVIVNYAGDAMPDELVLRGKVSEEYPDVVDFPKIKRGEQPEQIVTLATYPGQPPVAVQEISFDAAKFDITSRPGAKEGTVDVVFKPAANVPYGSVSDQVVVKTNDTDAPDKRMGVRVHVWKPLEAADRTITLRPGTDGGPVSAVVEFAARYGGPIADVSASITREKRFTAEVEPGPPGDTVRVRVTADPPEKTKRPHIVSALKVTAKVGEAEAEDQVSIILVLDDSVVVPKMGGAGMRGSAPAPEADGASVADIDPKGPETKG